MSSLNIFGIDLGNIFSRAQGKWTTLPSGWNSTNTADIRKYADSFNWDDQAFLNRYNAIAEQERFDYQKALQQQIFAREDSSIQRSVQDARSAGLSPLAGLNGAGAGSAVPVSDSSPMRAGDSSSFNPLALLSNLQSLKVGQEQTNLLREQVGKAKADKEYQEAVNAYFKEHGMLPTTEDKTMAYVMQFLQGLFGNGNNGTSLVQAGQTVHDYMSSEGTRGAYGSENTFSDSGVKTNSITGTSTEPSLNYSFNRPFDLARDLHKVMSSDLSKVNKAKELYYMFTGERTYGSADIVDYFIDKDDNIHFLIQTGHGKKSIHYYPLPQGF